MIPSSELMTFSCSERSFFADNLLDADDWEKDISMDVKHSPESPLKYDELQYIPDYSANSLQYDCLDSFLESSKLGLKNKFPGEPAIPTSTSYPIICNAAMSITNNNSISISNVPLVPSSPLPELNTIVPPVTQFKTKVVTPTTSTISNISKNVTNRITDSMQNLTKMKNIQAIKEQDVPVLTSLTSLPIIAPTVVKLENGQFYVARTVKKTTVLTNANQNQNTLKNGTKKDSQFKVESIHQINLSRDINELKKYKRQQRMVKNRESACLSRQRKKDHLKMLESCVTDISSMNEHLREENESLKQRIQILENENSLLREKSKDNVKEKVKKSSVLFVIIFIFIFNIIGSPPGKMVDVEKTLYEKDIFLTNRQVTFHSRSLLQFGNSNVNPGEMKVRYHPHPQPEPFNVADDLHSNNGMKTYNRRIKLKKNVDSQEDQETVNCGEQFNETYIKRINNALNGLVKGLRKEKDESKLLRKSSKDKQYVISITNSSYVRQPKKGRPDNCTDRKHKHRPLMFLKNFKVEKYRKKIPGNRDAFLNLTSQELANVIQKSIDRKPDTFYVVTSWKDFLTILPSTNNSNFHRPKVTFMIPAFHNNETFKGYNKLTMLKIDCYVIDTALVQLNQNMVSKSLLTQL